MYNDILCDKLQEIYQDKPDFFVMVDEYVAEINKLFKSRIVCLLFYGSRATENAILTPTSDYDFCLLLTTQKSDDIAKLRKLSFKFKYELVDTNFFYLDELEKRGWSNFQFGNHGVFSLLYLAAAKPVLGKNIFATKLSLVDRLQVEKSLQAQIMEYFWRLDNWILSIKDDATLVHKLQKYLLRITYDMQALQGDLTFQEINEADKKKFVATQINDKDYLSDTTKELFAGFYRDPTLALLLALKDSLRSDYITLEYDRSLAGATERSAELAEADEEETILYEPTLL